MRRQYGTIEKRKKYIHFKSIAQNIVDQLRAMYMYYRVVKNTSILYETYAQIHIVYIVSFQV